MTRKRERDVLYGKEKVKTSAVSSCYIFQAIECQANLLTKLRYFLFIQEESYKARSLNEKSHTHVRLIVICKSSLLVFLQPISRDFWTNSAHFCLGKTTTSKSLFQSNLIQPIFLSNLLLPEREQINYFKH